MPLTANKIYKYVEYSSTYQKGERYYLDGRVSNFEIQSGGSLPDDAEHLVGTVRGTDSYCVEVTLSGTGDILDYDCECEAFKNYDGMCKHVVAVLLYRLNFYSNWSLPQNALKGSANMAVKSKKRSDNVVHNLIQKCMREELSETESELQTSDEQITLVPTLLFNKRGNAEITLTIGNTRQYVVKNVDDLCRNVLNHTVVKYGKALTCDHNTKLFDEKSRSLMQLLMNKYKERIAVEHYYYGYGYSNDRNCTLSTSMLDKFFEIYLGGEIGIEHGNHHPQKAKLVDFAAKIPLRATKVEDGISVSCHSIDALVGESFCYILNEDSIYRCPGEYKVFYDNFLEGLLSNGSKVFVATEDMPDFFNVVIPSISEYATISGAADYLSAYAPDELESELYLDATDKNNISAVLNFCYGSIKINSFSREKAEDVKRDKFGEAKANLLVKHLFEADAASQCYRISGSDDVIYNFVSTALPKLMELFKVFATDSFKAIKIVPPSKTTIGVSVQSNLLEIDIKDIAFPLDELDEILAGYRQNKKYHRLKDGSFLSLEDSTIDSVAQLVDGLDITKKQLENGKVTMPLHRAMFVDSLMNGDENISFKRDSHFKELIRTMKSVEDSDFAVPQSLDNVLRNYQKIGFRWLKTMEQCGFSGILADDMGLGKTLQIIAVLLSAKEFGNKMPSLIVCPSSLIFNWMDEFSKFAPSITVLPVLGSAQKRTAEIETACDYDVVITSYDLLKRDSELYQNIEFYYQVIDEAQYIKNHTTKAAQGTKVINSRYRCALTGTPIENRISELWSIFDFLMPMYLYGYSKFRGKFELPIVKEKDEQALSRLEKMVAPFVLRRMKKDVLKELPEKTETVIYTSMEEEQEKLYLANLVSAREEMSHGEAKTNKIAIFAMLTRLRQLCCDPTLCYENYTGGSGKLNTCIELIQEAVDGGHKVLLFSQFTSMLAIIEKCLIKESISYFKLQGSTKKEDRHDMVERFNSDRTQVFLISLKAGGTGLNLTSADVVIHYDPWWNLAAQNQATDRAYRIGQVNNVSVYKLIAKNTIEEKIIKLQLTKKDLVDSVIKEGEGLLSSITKEDLFDLF